MQCKQCNKQIEQTEGKKSKVFCSDKCRMAYNRTIKSEHLNPNKSNPNKSEQPNPNTVIQSGQSYADKSNNGQIKSDEQIRIDNPDMSLQDVIKIWQRQFKKAKCKSCGADVYHAVDICLQCTTKGITRQSLSI